jgi:hypothetical protein
MGGRAVPYARAELQMPDGSRAEAVADARGRAVLRGFVPRQPGTHSVIAWVEVAAQRAEARWEFQADPRADEDQGTHR